MAIYFQFNRKSDGSLVTPAQADDEMRETLGYEKDPKNWLEYWYQRIGITLASGKHDFQEMQKDWPELENIINHIRDNYDITSGWCR